MKFPLPRLLALAALSCTATFAHGQGAGFTFQDKAGEYLDVLRDGKVIARYMYAHDPSESRRDETYKPYLHVFDPAGKAPITKGPGGTFPHHRGIYIGWNNIEANGKRYDRWHMKGGEQVHTKFSVRTGGADRATFTSVVRWMGDTAESTLIEEERTLTFLLAPAPAYAVIDMVSKIKAVAGEISLGGDPEHAGLHYRPAEEVDRTQTKYFFPKEDANAKQDRDYPWFGESYVLNGARYAVVYLNHPSNPKNARASAYRDYGRFGDFWTAKIPAGGTAEFRARFLIAAGDLPSAEVIQKAWNEYAGANDPTPKTTLKAADNARPAATPAPKSSSLTPEAATPKADAAPPVPAGSKATVDAGPKPANAPPQDLAKVLALAKAKRRAGGGPEDPELKFRLPAPPVLTPEAMLKTLKVAPGFKVQLVAAEPMIEAPVALSWDDQGRLYVLEMRGYMHDVDALGEDQPLGRVARLEDTNGDGTMDKRTVFADGLVMPRAIMALGDGLLIGEPPNLTFHRDSNGDGVADSKEVVATDYGRKEGQPEHMANSLTWMQDNWIWSSNHPAKYRYQGGKFITEKVVASGQWGRTQDDWGRHYYNYNSDFLRSDLVPRDYYARNAQMPVQSMMNVKLVTNQIIWPSHPTPGVNRGYENLLRNDGTLKACTATCGPAIYRGDLFPAEFRGNAFIPEPSGNLLKRFVLRDADGGVKAENAYEGTEFLTSTDERFRPVNAYTGPDGALYVVDMARGVIQHRGFLTYYLVANIKDRNLEQPIHLGRILRIVPDGSKPATVKLPKATGQLVPLLAHGNGWVRDTAQRVLVERGDAAAVPALRQLAKDAPTPQARLHALWTLEGLAALTPEVLSVSLKDANQKVRLAAVRLADATLVPNLVKMAADPSREVRLHLAFRLGGETAPGVQAALISLLREGHPAIDEAVASGVAGREGDLLDALLKAARPDDTKLAESGIYETLAGCIAKERNGEKVGRLLEIAAAQPAGDPGQIAILAALAGRQGRQGGKSAAGSGPRPIKLAAQPVALTRLMNTPDAKARPLLTRIETQLTWPGKTGAGESAPVPLTAEEQALFKKGETLYATCAACHQANGGGMAGLAPPLANSEWVEGPADRPMRIILHGMTGPIEVAGTKWQLDMPGLPTFSDEDIAGILTYIRRSWDNNGSAVTPAEVAKVREATKGRSKSWTAEELLAAPGVKTVSAN